MPPATGAGVAGPWRSETRRPEAVEAFLRDKLTVRHLRTPILPALLGTVFTNGDRVRLANDRGGHRLEPVGTVIALVPYHLKDGSSVREVLVRWDTGVELAVAPDRLVLAAPES